MYFEEIAQLIVEVPLSRVVQRNFNVLTRCLKHMAGQDIIRLCMQCDISLRQHSKVVHVIIPSV